MNVFASSEMLAAMNSDFLSQLKGVTEKSANGVRGPPKSAEGKASRENAKRRPKVPPMNEFATNAMQWAYSSQTELGEQKLFYRKGKWVLLEKSSDGYIELGAYTYSQYELVKKEISEYNEKLSEQRNSQRREIEAVRESVMLYETDGGHNTRDRGHARGQQARDGSTGGLHQGESESNRSGDNKEGKYDSGHFSQELDIKYLNENIEERERSTRELLANMLDTVAESEREKNLLAKYKTIIARQRQRYTTVKKNIYDRRHISEAREKLSGVVKELDKLLRNGTKERNVYYELQGAVASALELTEILEFNCRFDKNRS